MTPRICPLCNDIEEIAVPCTCGSKMRDAGPVSDYYGPYSPYFNAAFAAPDCLHLFTCPRCGQDKRVKIPLGCPFPTCPPDVDDRCRDQAKEGGRQIAASSHPRFPATRGAAGRSTPPWWPSPR